ncbi:MAG: hypothetical protein O7F74_11610 [Bacteroidetes bacterium]|nr:hypothetical protein [Bacteroidota bacterium]
MYLSGKLNINPAQLTEIEKIKPHKAFKKILYFITGGSIADKRERETFTAISILQQLNMVFRSMGITNIVRISQDDIDFYFDTQGKEDDLQDALDKYDIEMDEDVSRYFNVLYLVLEHLHGSYNYLIEIRINRTHDVGHHPIEIIINGLLVDFKSDGAKTQNVTDKMGEVFSSQENYDKYIKDKQEEFENFLNQLDQNIKKYIPIKEIEIQHQTRIIVPKEKIDQPGSIRKSTSSSDPVFYGYYGMSDYFFYSYMWSSYSHDHHIHVQDTHLVTDEGAMIGHISEEGVNAGEAGVFDPEVPYEEKMEGAGEYVETTDSEVLQSTEADSDSGWFDSGGDASESSCSSCSSCGGD